MSKIHADAAASIVNLYDGARPLLFAEGLLFAVAAVIMFHDPIAIFTAITVVVGVALTLFGLYRAICGFVTARRFGGGGGDVFLGLINIILGVLFCVFPTGSMRGIVCMFLVVFFLRAVGAIAFAVNMIRARFGNYIIYSLVALILVVMAIWLMMHPAIGAVAMVYYLASTLLLYAFADFYMYIELVRMRRAVLD